MAAAGSPQGFGAHWLLRQRLGEPAEVCTFYSYKGGTGRSMGLVNCAGLIAQQLPEGAKPLLLLDFDLEAPGLHRYLSPGMVGYEPVRQPGVLELFTALDELVANELARRGVAALDDETTARLVAGLDLAPFKVTVRLPGADGSGGSGAATMELIVAGRFDHDYDARLEAFRWKRLHDRAPALFRAFSARLAAEHSFVFIDSRTGLSDTSGISTMLLPDVLVVVFTPNAQSLTGVDHLVRKAVGYRAAAADMRPLRVVPLPSRVDNNVEHFRQVWRMGQAGHPLFGDVDGYQPLFTRLFGDTLAAGIQELAPRLGEYFDQVQVPHTADYAFGERLCFTPQASSDSLSIRGAYELFLPWLVTGAQPWERPAARLLDLRAALWLRDAGVGAAPPSDDGWSAWFDRVARVTAGDDTADMAVTALAAERRFDIALAQSLAQAHMGEFGPAWALLEMAEAAYDDDVAPTLERQAPAALLRLMRGDAPSPEVQGDAVLWLDGMHRLMARWQSLPGEQHDWLAALLTLATEWGMAELRWRVSVQLEGAENPAAQQAQLALAEARERAGDFAGALQITQALLEHVPLDSALRDDAFELLNRLGSRLSAGESRPLPHIADCDYSAWLSYAQADDEALDHWITQFSGELNRGLRSTLRGVKVPPLASATKSGLAEGQLSGTVFRMLARSFAFVLVVGDHGSRSDLCQREAERFVEMYGSAARERFYVVTLTPSAQERVLDWPLWRHRAWEPPVPMPFFADIDKPAPLLRGSDGSADSAVAERINRLRDDLAQQIRRSAAFSEKSSSAASEPRQAYTRETPEQLLPEPSIDVRIVDTAVLPPIDPAVLANELAELRLAAATRATESAHYTDLAALADAERMARAGDLGQALTHLRRASGWLWAVAGTSGHHPALDAARDSGTGIA